MCINWSGQTSLNLYSYKTAMTASGNFYTSHFVVCMQNSKLYFMDTSHTRGILQAYIGPGNKALEVPWLEQGILTFQVSLYDNALFVTKAISIWIMQVSLFKCSDYQILLYIEYAVIKLLTWNSARQSSTVKAMSFTASPCFMRYSPISVWVYDQVIHYITMYCVCVCVCVCVCMHPPLPELRTYVAHTWNTTPGNNYKIIHI